MTAIISETPKPTGWTCTPPSGSGGQLCLSLLGGPRSSRRFGGETICRYGVWLGCVWERSNPKEPSPGSAASARSAASCPMKSKMTARGDASAHELGGVEARRRSRIPRRNVLGRPGEQAERHQDVRELDPPSANADGSINQPVVSAITRSEQEEAKRAIAGLATWCVASRRVALRAAASHRGSGSEAAVPMLVTGVARLLGRAADRANTPGVPLRPRTDIRRFSGGIIRRCDGRRMFVYRLTSLLGAVEIRPNRSSRLGPLVRSPL